MVSPRMVADAREPLTGAAPRSDPAPLDIYRSLFEHAVNGLAFHQILLNERGEPSDYVFLAVNAAFEEQTGLSKDAVVGRRVTEVLPGIERDPADWIGRYGRVALTGETVRFQQFSAPLQRWYDVSAFSPARGFFAVVFNDVTEHRRLEDALRASERRYQRQSIEMTALLNATHAQLALLDEEMRFVMVNDAYERACGRPRAELIGRSHFELFPNEDNERIFRHVAATGEPFYVEEKAFEYPGQPERMTWWSWSLVPVKADDGAPQGLLLSLIDVTAQVAARKQIERADQQKNDFLGILSHELRNPLAPVRHALWLLDNTAASDERHARARATIDRQVSHLARIVDDLLDVTRITRGKIRIQSEPLDLVELVRGTIDDYRGLAAERAIGLVYRGDGPLWVSADRTRIAQVVGNLLHNALKFTSPGGRVWITCGGASPGEAVVSVRDDGAGIAPEMLTRLFSPFTQADESLHRTRGGLGLGLALSKGLVDLHGGTIEVRSAGPGAGAEFLVRLPRIAPELAAGRAEPAPACAPRRVLVVEDNVDAGETLREVLLALGHEVALAHDGCAGLELARSFRPDVIMCDIGLPVMDGFAVARAVRADSALAAVRLVAITGYASPEDRARALEAGFDQHLGKPVSIDAIERLLAATAAPGR